MSESDKIREILIRSGFPLQLAVESSIRATHSESGWDVLYREHPWRDDQTGASGFIDIVAYKKPHYAIIECKKVAPDSDPWVFIADSTRARERYRAVLSSILIEHGRPWEGFNSVPRLIPAGEEAEFFANRRDRNRPTMERMCGELLQSVSAYTVEVSRALCAHGRSNESATLIPMIVTNAELQIARVDPSTVSLESGELPEVETMPVEWLRFHKTLASEAVRIESALNEFIHLDEAHRLQERTVLICRARNVPRLLSIIG